MKKGRGLIVMGIILSLLSALGLNGCEKNKFKPSPDAVITELHISYSGMMRGSEYGFSLVADGDSVLFSGDYFTHNDDGGITKHHFENVYVDRSYMDELRKFAAETGLVESMRKYRKPSVKPPLLDGDSKYTSITMSDGSQKAAETIFNSGYHDFFRSITEAYSEFDLGDSYTDDSDDG